jgi:hypothetical protein
MIELFFGMDEQHEESMESAVGGQMMAGLLPILIVRLDNQIVTEYGTKDIRDTILRSYMSLCWQQQMA